MVAIRLQMLTACCVFCCTINGFSQSVQTRDLKKAYKSFGKILNDFYQNDNKADTTVCVELQRIESVLRKKLSEDSSENEYYGYDLDAVIALKLYIQSFTGFDRKSGLHLLDSGLQHYINAYDNNVNIAAFEGDIFYERMEEFYSGNLWEILNLRVLRMERSMEENNYLRFIRALVDLAETEKELGYFEKSLQHIREARAEISNPKSTSKERWHRWYNKEFIAKTAAQHASLLIMRDSIEQAGEIIAETEKLIKTEADYFYYKELYVAKAHWLLSSGKYVKALQMLDMFIQDQRTVDPAIDGFIALCYKLNGTMEMAEQYYRKSLHGFLQHDVTGLQLPEACLNLAIYFSEIGKTDSAMIYAKQSYQKLRDFIALNFVLMSTREKQTALRRQEIFLTQLGALAQNKQITENTEFAGLLLNFSLMYKGISFYIQDLVYERTAADTLLTEDVQNLRYYLNKIGWNYHPLHKSKYIETSAEEIEKEIYRKCFSEGLPNPIPDAEKLLENLDSQTLFVDYIPLDSKHGYRNYLAVGAMGGRKPFVFSIFNDSVIHYSYHASELASRGNNVYLKRMVKPGEFLRTKLFPKDSVLWHVQQIVVAPAGRLFEVPFHAMAAEENRLIPVISLISPMTLSSGDKDSLNTGNAWLLAYGGAEFNHLYMWQSGTDSLLRICEGSWENLTSTTSEVLSVKKVFRTRSVRNGRQFTEQMFKARFTGFDRDDFRVIHVASHGYHTGISEGNYFESSYNPLLRSGILASGANCAWHADSATYMYLADHCYGNDGVITAQEISSLDLHDVNLVVLSACETGKGVSESIEGPTGLPRAFKNAGAKWVMVTLWPVSDAETAEFIKVFYQNLKRLKQVNPALHETRLAFRDAGASEMVWAAFTLYR